MSKLFYTAVNRCFGKAFNISFSLNSHTILILQRRIPSREVFQKIHTQTLLCNRIIVQQFGAVHNTQIKYLSTSANSPPDTPNKAEEQKKLSLYQRLKSMYKDYWYVLVPVHAVTSVCWYGGFYYLAKSGVDIVALLEGLNISDKFIQPLRDGHSTTGYLALAYALYKLSTPLRYTVTIGGTTISINYLKHWGYIKPMPSKEQLKVLYQERKETFQEKKQEIKDSFQERKQEFKDNVIQKIKDIEATKKKS